MCTFMTTRAGIAHLVVFDMKCGFEPGFGNCFFVLQQKRPVPGQLSTENCL